MSDATAREEALQRELRETRDALNAARSEITELRALVGERNMRQLGIVDHTNLSTQALSR